MRTLRYLLAAALICVAVPSYADLGGPTVINSGTGILCTPNPLIAVGTCATTVTNNAQTGTTYAVLATDGGRVVSASNSSSEAYSVAAANTTGFTSGFGFDLNNIGAGVTTLTATTSLFDNGLTTLALTQGQDAYIYSDGANYHSVVSMPVLAADTLLGNFSAASNYPIAGALTSCSGASSALTYNTSTHAFGCNTISGSGSPGGSTTQVQYNNAGAFGGIAGATTNGSFMTLGGVTAAASTPSVLFNGIPFAAGTATTNFPASYFNASGASAPTTLSTAGTMVGINAPSAFAGNLIDAHVNGGASVFNVNSAGNIVASKLDLSGAANQDVNLNGASAIQVAGTSKLAFSGGTIFYGAEFQSGTTNGAALLLPLSTASVPDIVPNYGAATTGIGGTSGTISLIIAGVEKERITTEGLLSIQATAPVPTGTGTPTIATGSTDSIGEVTAGATATSVIITFNLTHANAPFCVVTPQTQLVAFSYTVSNTALTITQTATSGDKIDYNCGFH